MTRRALWALLAAALSAASAEAAGPGDVRAEVDEIAAIVANLEGAYLAPALYEQSNQLAVKLSEGELFFVTQDYERSALVLLDVVETPSAKSSPGFKDAVYYLAESLFQIRNFDESGRFFEQLLKEGSGERRQLAIGRLLEIALLTHDAARADRFLQEAQGLLANNPDPALLYAVGKFRYRTGDRSGGRVLLARVPDTHADYPRAQYFCGTIDVAEGRLDDALTTYKGLLTWAQSKGTLDTTGKAVADQARLAIARLYYEQAAFDQAVEAYSAISRESSSFDEALYESVWIAIKQQDYQRALRMLEVRLISQPDVLKGPESRLLQGKLLLMLERYEDASESFQEVLFEFGPIQTEMRQVVDENRGDLVSYFNRVIGQNIENFDLSSFLPRKAAEFAGPDAEADRALMLVSDLASQRRDVEEARKTIGRLEAALTADNRVEIFPKLYEGWLKNIEARARIAEAKAAIVEAASSGISDPAFLALSGKRSQLGTEFREAPRSLVALQAREVHLEEQLKALDQEAYRVRLEVRALDAQLAAIDKYIKDVEKADGELPKHAAVRRQLEIERTETEKLIQQAISITEDIERERIRAGAGDETSRKEQGVRQAYSTAAAAERAWLQEHGVATATTEWLMLEQLESRLDVFTQKVTTLVDERVADIRRQLEREKANVADYDGRLVAFQGETESLGGSIAARSFEHVMDRVSEVVLEADVGLVDVSWKQKQDTSDQLSGIMARQKAEIDVLNRSLSEVSRD